MKQTIPFHSQNVLGGPLEACCFAPMTGFHRDGYCRTGPQDAGVHAVCTEVTQEFLDYSKEAGNDLSTPVPEYGFPGLRPGDRWCVCAARWKECLEAGVPAPVVLRATQAAALEYVSLDDLKDNAVDRDSLDEE